MGIGGQPAALWLCMLVAAGLRLFDLDIIEFKGDEAVAIHLALPLVEGRALPLVGLMSSVGVHNPPLFIYLVSLPAGLDFDPRFVTGGLIGLSHVIAVGLTFLMARPRFGLPAATAAALFFACAPWAVLYGRKLWAQDVLPPLCVGLLWAGCRFWERPRSKVVALFPILLCALFQLHYSAVGMILMCAAMLAVGFRRIHMKALGAGVAVALLMLGPYMVFQFRHDFRDLRGFAKMAAGKRANGKPRKHEKRWTIEPIVLAAQVATDHTLDYATGPSRKEYTRSRGALDLGLASAARRVGLGLLALGCAVLVFGLRPGQAGRPHRGALIALAFWVGGYLAAMLWLRLEEQYPHYFIILYPGTFLLMALPVAALWNQERPGMRALAALSVVVVIAGNITTLHGFHRYIRERGGTAGDYGVAFHHKAELARWAVGQRLPIATRYWEYGYLYRMTDAFGDNAAIRAELAARGSAPDGTRRLRLYNALWRPKVAGKRCQGRQDFGPLVVCPQR